MSYQCNWDVHFALVLVGLIALGVWSGLMITLFERYGSVQPNSRFPRYRLE